MDFNLIYVIGFIAWIIYNIYKAGKKLSGGNSKSPSVPETKKPTSDLERTIRDLLEGKQPEKPEPDPYPEVATTETYQSPEESYTETAFDGENIFADGKSHSQKEIKENMKLFDEEYENVSRQHDLGEEPKGQERNEETENDILDDFDAAKAVLYSEILKRPTY